MMISHQRIGMIGLGRMGSAIATGMVAKGHFQPEQFLVFSPSLQRGTQKTIFPVAENNLAVAQWADLLFLVTKPKQVQAVCQEIAPVIAKRAIKPVVVSVAAGVLVDTIQKNMGIKELPIMRIMTNIPALIGAGMSAWFANEYVTQDAGAIVQESLTAMGQAMRVDTESKLDSVTAIAGSGPAYFFYMQECLVAAAKALGLSHDEAVLLVRQTALGACLMAAESDLPLESLRQQVTSPQGTTAAGLAMLMAGGFNTAIDACVKAAFNRAIELSQV